MESTPAAVAVRRAARALAVSVAATLLAAPESSATQHPGFGDDAPRPPAEVSYDPVGEAGAAAWRADIATFGAELARRHGNVYHSVDSAALAASLEELSGRVPALARHEIIAGLIRIAASIGDGHTSVPFLFDPAAGLRPVPLRFAHFEEGIFVRGAGPGFDELAGARLVGVGEATIEQVWERLTPLVPRDNDIWLRLVVPMLIGFPEILHAVGLTDDPARAPYRFRAPDGAFERVIDAEAGGPPSHAGDALPEGWTDARPPGAWALAPALAPRPQPYWSAYLPDEATLYVRFDQVNDARDGPGVHEFFGAAFRDADGRGMRRFVLDIRANNGGEGMLNYGIVREVLSRPELNRPGRVWVIIGRGTFSAAQVLAHMFDTWTEATFVGEPTGSSPRFWGDHSFFRLPHSGLLVSASPTWWQPGGPYDRRPYLPPALAFEPRFDDYVAGRDPALAAILGDGAVSLEARVRGALAGGVEEVAAVARAWGEEPVSRYVRLTSELNRLGYALLREDADAGLAVFRANVSLHPEYANGWDSLGEVLLAQGRTEEGLDAYRRAYALDPEVGRAAEVLDRHGR